MTFIILAVTGLLVFAVFRKYSSIASVVITIALLLALTTAALVWGTWALDGGDEVLIFRSGMSGCELYSLLAAWYALDLAAGVRIIMNHIEYRKVNNPRR